MFDDAARESRNGRARQTKLQCTQSKGEKNKMKNEPLCVEMQAGKWRQKRGCKAQTEFRELDARLQEASPKGSERAGFRRLESKGAPTNERRETKTVRSESQGPVRVVERKLEYQ